MSWLDQLLDRGMQAIKPVELVATKPARPRLTKPEVRSVWIQIRPPRDADLGAVEAAYYFVADGVLSMCDENGKPTGKEHWLEPNDNAHRIAGRLAREIWRKAAGISDFNRPLHCSVDWMA
jgi:hypothetical protein